MSSTPSEFPLPSGLKQWRGYRGLTQGQLADVLGIGQETISKWELGRGMPRVDQAHKLRRFLGAPTVDAVFPEVVEPTRRRRTVRARRPRPSGAAA
jgi:transcriptional regulator with XRE-family HTH domain